MTPARSLHHSVKAGLWLATLAVAWLIAVTASAQEFPVLTGRVVDQANLLSPAVETELTSKLEALERDSSDQLVVATIADLQGYEIEDYGYRLGRAWGIGQDQTDNGVLLIVAPNERKVRIEVGYGLEGVLTDALSGLIIQQQILPAFRDDDYERGVVQGVDALDQQLRLDPAEAAARAAEAEQAESDDTAGPAIGMAFFVFLVVMFWVVVLSGGGRRGRRRADGVWIWAASEALRHSSGRGGGSSWGGGGGGGGGFGGGGGSFGGGGASGGW